MVECLNDSVGRESIQKQSIELNEQSHTISSYRLSVTWKQTLQSLSVAAEIHEILGRSSGLVFLCGSWPSEDAQEKS